jgi:NAD(P)-dependent dehydrogenase (short-subunit alcohol dehydrogenase family)
MPVAVVTGTSTGIGFATSVALARAGHRVQATMRSPQRAPQLAETTAAEKLPIRLTARFRTIGLRPNLSDRTRGPLCLFIDVQTPQYRSMTFC